LRNGFITNWFGWFYLRVEKLCGGQKTGGNTEGEQTTVSLGFVPGNDLGVGENTPWGEKMGKGGLHLGIVPT